MHQKKKQRFRDIKQGKVAQPSSQEKKKEYSFKHPYASLGDRIKAFITDSFMLLMPIMYIVIYFVMGDREGFQSHMLSGWLYILIPLVIIQTLFFAKSAQTPGFRAYNLKLINESTGEKPSFAIIIFRNLCTILSFFSLFGWLMMFFRKDRKTLHDLLSNTAVITTA